MNEATIIVPVDIDRFSQNQRGRTWQVKAAMTKQGRKIGAIAWMIARRPQIGEDARINVVVRRGRRIDVTNAIGALKPIIDGIFRDGLNIDDSRVTIGEVAFETGRHWKGREEVELRFAWEPRAVKLTGKAGDDDAG